MEQPAKVLGVFKAQVVGDLTGGHIGGQQQGFGPLDDKVVDVILSAESEFSFDVFAEFARRDVKIRGNEVHAGKALSFMLVGGVVLNQVVLQFRDEIVGEGRAGQVEILVQSQDVIEQEF